VLLGESGRAAGKDGQSEQERFDDVHRVFLLEFREHSTLLVREPTRSIRRASCAVYQIRPTFIESFRRAPGGRRGLRPSQ